MSQGMFSVEHVDIMACLLYRIVENMDLIGYEISLLAEQKCI